MQRRIGDVVIESIAAESPKFTAALVFIHGLWCTAAVWRKFMGYFAHRGWTSHAINLRGHADHATLDLGRVRFVDYLQDVRDVVAACETPPVLVGHDVGALLAAVSATAARAVVALTPLVPHRLTTAANFTIASWRTRWAMARSRPLPPPQGRRRLAYYSVDPPGGLTPDASGVWRDLQQGTMALTPAGTPTLLLAGAADPIAPASAVEQLAMQLNAGFRCVDGATHAMPWEPGWEHRVAEIHRWLIRTLGDGLLLEREDEDGE